MPGRVACSALVSLGKALHSRSAAAASSLSLGQGGGESGCCRCHCLTRRLSYESHSEVSSFMMVFSLGQKFTLFATYSPLSTFDSYTALGLHVGFG